MPGLNRFGVPYPGGGVRDRGGILQPKLKYRFRVRTVNFGPTNDQVNLTQQVMNVGKPKFSQEEVVLDSYNSKAWVGGKHTWETIPLVVRDDITNSVKKLVDYQVQKQINHFEQTSPAAGMNYKFTTFIETMDGGNTTVFETWTLDGCWLQAVDWDAADYTASEQMIITMTVRFDNATCTETFPSNPQPTNPGGTFINENR